MVFEVLLLLLTDSLHFGLSVVLPNIRLESSNSTHHLVQQLQSLLSEGTCFLSKEAQELPTNKLSEHQRNKQQKNPDNRYTDQSVEQDEVESENKGLEEEMHQETVTEVENSEISRSRIDDGTF